MSLQLHFKVLLPILLVFCCASLALGQDDRERVFLLGNTADIKANSNFFSDLPKLLPSEEEFVILLNGDLLKGDESKEELEQSHAQIIKLLKPLSELENGRVIILPGDRDWRASGKKGLESVKALEKFIKSLDYNNVKWAIKKGCPGPDLIEINENLVVVAISSQWFNHPYAKPTAATAECKFSTERDFLIELENVVEDSEGKNILVAGHFPLESLGQYNGNYPAKSYLSPPIIGSFIVGYNQNIGSSKHISNKKFEFIRGTIENIILRKGSVIYASGHEHNLQILHLSEDTYVVNSGSPTKARYVATEKDQTVYAEATAGLVELIYEPSGKISYVTQEYNETSGFSKGNEGTPIASSCEPEIEGVPSNGLYIPCKEEIKVVTESSTWPAEATVIAGDYNVGGFTHFLLGEHYRKTWDTPVKVPYLNLEEQFGGLTVYEKGGGHQTTSLKIKGGDGKEYVFRSVDKDPSQLLPFELQNTVVSRTLQDVTSLQQPYGAMVVGSMLDATEILHARPKLYIMPPSDELGGFKPKYGNLLGMLEEKPKNVKDVKVPFAGADNILQSRKMFRDLYRDNSSHVDSKEYAKARMFDILIGDWGKHEDNWKWAGFETDEGTLYRPIPRDRDYVFSRWDGFITYLVDRKWGLEQGENFGYTINDIRSLTFTSQPADRLLLNELSREDWQEAAEYIQTRITDEVIEKGIKTMPAEVYEVSGKEIAAKLKQRRGDLKEYADQYFEQLMYKGAEVVGTNKKEIFEVTRNADGSVRVMMFDKKKKKLYERLFLPKETAEIRLYGLGGKDDFMINGESDKSIKVRVIGGGDPDDIIDNSVVKRGGKKTLIYEKSKSSDIQLGKEGKRIDTWNKSLYDYDRYRFGFNRYLPLGAITYNSQQGLGLLLGVSFKTYNPVKEDYGTKHTISGFFTTENINVLKYNGRFHHVLGKWDITLDGIYANQNTLNNFFGFGNGSTNDDALDDDDFYLVNYNTNGVGVGVIRDFWQKSYVSFKADYESNETIREAGRIFGAPDNSPLLEGVFGLGDLNLVELQAAVDIDFRDRANLPEKGARFYADFNNGIVMDADEFEGSGSENYGIATGFIEQYLSTRAKNPMTLALKVGGSTSYGSENIPFYKLKFLGQNGNNLRGFDNNRFTGAHTAYFNSELRFQLSEFKTTFLPMKFGVKGFFDTGRAFSDLDTTDTWHVGYGVGAYLVPLTESFAITLSAGFSDEESAILRISIGSTFR